MNYIRDIQKKLKKNLCGKTNKVMKKSSKK